MTTQNQRPLKLFLLDLSPHNQAILEFFVAGAGRNTFELVSDPADAEAFITDFDFPGARKHWEDEYSGQARPCIAISMENLHANGVEWISKPITSQGLVTVAKTIQERAGGSVAPVAPKEQPLPEAEKRPRLFKRDFANPGASPFTNSPGRTSGAVRLREEKSTAKDVKHAVSTLVAAGEPAKAEKAKPPQKSAESKTAVSKDSSVDRNKASPPPAEPAPQKSNAELQKRWELLCGKFDDLSAAEFKKHDNIHYNCENYFQCSLIAALRLGKQTRQVIQIKYEPHQFFLFYDESLIFSELGPDSTEYAGLCKKAVKPGQVNLHILNAGETADMKKRLKEPARNIYDLESFIWTSSLLSSGGRVPLSFDEQTIYLLKYWPNFTRIESFPFAMKIAALWHHEPNRLHEMASKLQIPQRYIIAFFNGAAGLSLFETDQKKISGRAQVKTRKKSGILARLFRRLSKGGTSTA